MCDKTDKIGEPDDLEPFFAASRTGPPALSDAVFARVMADAAAHQPVRMPVPRRPPLRGLLAALGGWPSVAGLTVATLAGIWIGAARPAGFGDLDTALGLVGIEGATEYGLEDLMPDYASLEES